MTTGLVAHPACERHDTGPGHAERRERLWAIEERLRAGGVGSELERLVPTELDPLRLELVHPRAYVESALARIAAGARMLDDGDTRVSAESGRAALCAAGGALAAVDRVHAGTWSNALVVTRPPGHHAERDHAMGFCIFNNAALCAAHLLATHGLERVAIVDWDVHHGNGTQHIFERDPRVFFASLHQWPLYPGTGLASERGLGAGEGTTLNLPQDPGSGDERWLAAFEDELLPALARYLPQFLIVSAGFDAHARDPLSQTELSTDAYRRMSAALLQLARESCGGRLVSVLEGGYDLQALAECVEAHAGELVRAP